MNYSENTREMAVQYERFLILSRRWALDPVCGQRKAKQFNLYTSVESDLQQKLNTSEESIHVTLCVNIDTRFTLDAV